VAGAPRTVATVRGNVRAGNLGHVTRLSNVLAGVAAGMHVDAADPKRADGDAFDDDEEEEDAEEEDAEEEEEDEDDVCFSTPTARSRRRARHAARFVSEKLAADPRWRSHADGDLATRNALENVRGWLCGRPAGNDDCGEEEDERSGDDERDFDLGVCAGGFSRDAFDRYGGASFEDDDDEEKEEEEEEAEEDAEDAEETRDRLDEEEEAIDDDGIDIDAFGAAGLFRGDAGSRFATLALTNDDDFASVFVPGTDAVPEETASFASNGFVVDDDRAVLEEDDLNSAEALRSPAADSFENAKTSPTESSDASEFGSVRYWGSSIDASLVPDDA